MIFLYAFLAIFCLGLAPLFGKSALHDINPVTTLIIRTFIAAGLVGIWLITTKTSIPFAALSLSGWFMITMEAVLAAVLGDLAYFYALQKGNVYEIAVFMACAPLVTIFLGSVFWGQSLSVRQLVGALVVTAGLVILCGD
jgi:transporter family protein